MGFISVREMLDASEKDRLPLWRVILREHMRDYEESEDASVERMTGLFRAMVQADENYRGADRSTSGMTGGDGQKLSEYAPNMLSGEFLSGVVARAVRMGECNACMKRIVAAPTAGSCGVLPAVFITLQKQKNIPEIEIVQALFVAAGFGQIIASRASIAGAEGGCQAEIGVASGMAAAGLCSVRGGTAEDCANACAMALKSLLGLVCDPVAGLVEVPCVKRNVIGAVNAVTSSDMALAGVRSRIPCDEVIDALREVGEALPASLRETGEGGIAATPTAREIAKRVFG
jgi:L-serine dehydratase